LGASVIRIDPLGGGADHHRWPVVGVGSGPDDAESYYWASLNKGKRSVAVDMRSDAGRELVTALIAAAGVLVDNVVGRRWMAGGAPVNHVLPAWDLVAGLSVSTAVLAALYDRDHTGRGTYVELALADVALAGVANLGWLSESAERGRDRPRHGNHVYGSFGVDFACSDGQRVMVVALTPGQWTALTS